MTSFLHLNLQEYDFEQNVNEMNKVCVCCASQTGALVNISTCKHTAFLKNYLKIKLDNNMYVCIFCHKMLEKIEGFQRQVEESVALLLNQAPVLKINKLHNLQRSFVEIDGSPQPESNIEVKQEPSDVDFENLDTQVKIEHDSSDFESEVPLAVIKEKKKSKIEEKCEGKIREVILSKEELQEEREKMAKSEKYLKLPYKCADCVIGFDHEPTYSSHMETRHKKIKNGFKCDVCKSVLVNKLSYKEHTKRHVKRLECMVCNRRYIHRQSAIQHYDEQHAAEGATIQQGYTCKECGYTTTSNRVYRYHMDKHKDKKSCNICGNTFINNSGLKVHMYTVHKQSPRVYECQQCDKTYRAKSGLLLHMRSVHSGQESRAFCSLCRTYFKTESGLAHHISTHSRHVTESDKRFICDECGAKFIKKNSLQAHINWEHLKISTHQCNKCSKIFKTTNALNRHVNFVHNKKRPPRDKICDYCGRGFTTQTILQSHIRTHTGERPLHCTHCPATFAHSAALYTHNKLLHNPK